MELQDVDRRCGQSGFDHPLVGIDEKADARDSGRNTGAQSGGAARCYGARARGIKHKTEVGRAAGARRRHRLLGR